jgi:hypothetical protein
MAIVGAAATSGADSVVAPVATVDQVGRVHRVHRIDRINRIDRNAAIVRPAMNTDPAFTIAGSEHAAG